MPKRINLLYLIFALLVWGIVARIAINSYLTYDFYREHYENFGSYLKSAFTLEHYQLWWQFLFSSTNNLLLVLTIFLPLLFIGAMYLYLEITDRLELKKIKNKYEQAAKEFKKQPKTTLQKPSRNKRKKKKRIRN